METSARYDLNEEIRKWRCSLEAMPGVSTDDLDELESHLRDTIGDLEKTGLASDEAFLVARKRMGKLEELQEEYAKSNPLRVWADRAFWIVGYIVFSLLLRSSLSCLSTLTVVGVSRFVARSNWLSMTGLSVKIIGDLLFLWIIVRIITRGSSWLERLAKAVVRHQAKSVIIVIFLCIAAYAVGLLSPLMLTKTLRTAELDQFYRWTTAETLLEQVLFYTVIIVAVRSIQPKDAVAGELTHGFQA